MPMLNFMLTVSDWISEPAGSRQWHHTVQLHFAQMARVESGGYQFIDSPVPPPPHRPSVSEELDTITSLPPSTPPHRKRGILRNPSSDSLHSHQSSSSSVSNVEHHKPGDRRDSKQVCFTCIPDIQPDCQADSSSDNHVGGDSTNGDRTNGASDELVNTTTGM